MAAKTQFEIQDLQKLLARYDIEQLVHCEAISSGTVQTNYVLTTIRGKYVFRYYESRHHDSVLFEIDVLTSLAAQGYRCPVPVRDAAGTYVHTCHGKPFVLFTYLEGQHKAELTSDDQMQIIQAVADLHRLTLGFQSEYTPARWNYSPELCLRLAGDEAKRVNTPDARGKLAWIEAQVAELELPAALPQGICHCDFHPSNILFRDGAFAGLIDFDDANYTYLIFDLACLIDTWAWAYQAEQPDWAKARDIVQRYDAYRALKSAEWHFLYDVHILSILFDAIWFWGRGTANDFYERRKIETLRDLGRVTYEQLVGHR